MTATISGTNGVTAATLVPSGSSAPTNGIYLPTTNAIAIATNSTNALYIDGSQNVGIGTTSPSTKLTISTAATTDAVRWTDNTNSTGLLSTTTGASTIWATAALAFGTGASTFTERMRIDTSGNVLVGVTNVYGNSTGLNAGKYIGSLTAGSAMCVGGDACLYLSKPSGYTNVYFEGYWVNGSSVGSITTNGSSTSFNTSSDYRLKTNVTPLTTAQSGPIIDALKPSQFTWKEDNTSDVGFIAHEMQAVIPRAVTGEKDAVDAEGKPVYQQVVVSSPEIIAYLVAEIQSLRARLKAANIA